MMRPRRGALCRWATVSTLCTAGLPMRKPVAASGLRTYWHICGESANETADGWA